MYTFKQIQAEADPVFYGQNDFPFSGTNDHMIACAYTRKKEQTNLYHLKNVTIAMTFRSLEYGNCRVDWCADWRRTDELYENMPCGVLHKEAHATFMYEKAWLILASMLNKAKSLTSLTLVLPLHVDVKPFDKPSRMQALHTFQNLSLARSSLKTRIVRLFVLSEKDAAGENVSDVLLDIWRLFRYSKIMYVKEIGEEALIKIQLEWICTR